MGYGFATSNDDYKGLLFEDTDLGKRGKKTVESPKFTTCESPLHF